jgi:hypothetical protein
MKGIFTLARVFFVVVWRWVFELDGPQFFIDLLLTSNDRVIIDQRLPRTVDSGHFVREQEH